MGIGQGRERNGKERGWEWGIFRKEAGLDSEQKTRK